MSNPAFNWKLLLRRLERQKAVLLLGPEVPMLGQEGAPPIKEALQSYVKEDLQEILQAYDLEKLEYYGEDGFFHLEDGYRSEAIYPILQFYKELQVRPIHEKLAELPFHFIFSLSPDDLLQQAMQAKGLPATFHYYDKRHYDKEADERILDFKPSLEKRLVYNVFGTIHNEGSLILSYDDLFEFLQRIFNNYHLPLTVRETIKEANCFVFVGFNYSKWYLKLLLRLMNLHEKVKTVYGMDSPERPELETFFVNEFDMNFTRLETHAFVEQLHAACAEAGLLVTSAAAQEADANLPAKVIEGIEEAVRQGNITGGLQTLQTYCEQHAMPAECARQQVQLAGRLAALQRDNNKGIIDYRSYQLQHNIIINDLLELVHQYS
ncbi:MAG: SIR2 family protein [Bacteroidota bacterium]